MKLQNSLTAFSLLALFAFTQCSKDDVKPQPMVTGPVSDSPATPDNTTPTPTPVTSTPTPAAPVSESESPGSGKELFTTSTANLPVWKRNLTEKTFFFKAKLLVDADGSPRCYHPVSDKGLDDLYMAGNPGDWWALATDNMQTNGRPLIQGPNDPAPGYYVSMTSLFDPSKEYKDPNRFVNAETVPYYILPHSLQKETGAGLGDFGAIIEPGGKVSFAIFADVGPEGKLGEASMFSAAELGINNNPRTGGEQANHITYIVFTGSSKGWPLSASQIKTEGERLLNEWGGKDELMKRVM